MFINDEFRVTRIGDYSAARSINIMNAQNGIGKNKNYILKFPSLKKQFLISSGSKDNFKSYKGAEICEDHNVKCINEVTVKVILENEKKNLKKTKDYEF